MRALVALALVLTLPIAACESDAGVAQSEDVFIGALTDADSPYLPDLSIQDTEGDDGEDAVEPSYPGNPCDRDEQCSTGLCYGRSSRQGFFEQSLCQTRCLALDDFSHYCDSDADCCAGTCCVGCGWREGLCVIE